MVDVSLQAPGSGPTLIHLLARLTGTGLAPPPRSLSSRLAHWIDWPNAVALASALDRADPTPAAPGAPVEDEVARLRAALATRIAGDRAFTAPDADGAFYRQRHVALQQLMDAEVRHLRARLRERLAWRGGALERLAALDAAMEPALGARERALLAAVPDLLVAHCERSREARRDAEPPAPPDWRLGFHREMQALLLAELDFRLQPVRGLQAALGTTGPTHAP